MCIIGHTHYLVDRPLANFNRYIRHISVSVHRNMKLSKKRTLLSMSVYCRTRKKPIGTRRKPVLLGGRWRRYGVGEEKRKKVIIYMYKHIVYVGLSRDRDGTGYA